MSRKVLCSVRNVGGGSAAEAVHVQVQERRGGGG